MKKVNKFTNDSSAATYKCLWLYKQFQFRLNLKLKTKFTFLFMLNNNFQDQINFKMKKRGKLTNDSSAATYKYLQLYKLVKIRLKFSWNQPKFT